MFDYETIATAFPETRKKYPWFPDRPKLFLSVYGDDIDFLLGFSCWAEGQLSKLLEFMKTYIDLNMIEDKEKIEKFHSIFSMIVVHVWMVENMINKLEAENYYPGLTPSIRREMKKILKNAIRLVVEGDSFWLGEHADWWVPKQRASRHKRKEK